MELAKNAVFADNVFSFFVARYSSLKKADMEYYENVLGLVGHTPLVKLTRLNKGLKPLILA
ncbi:MAG: hypothetical protein DMF70_10845, partial [Acidobacteria bacterium]